MSSVDNRIVNMQWNSKQFTEGAAESQRALQGMDQALANAGKSGSGLTTMGSQVEGLSGRFNAMKIAGITAIATIASKATSAGLNLVKSLTLDPLTQGFQEYSTNLNSIQTIMANTGKSVGVVNGYLQDLNHYSDQTIYSFSQMADSIGKFTAAGVPIAAATSSIKGMANTAALSGSNVQQLNTAMYQMSQALSTGTIRLMDWNSLANAGMGGSNIREALMATNKTLGDHGVAMEGAIQEAGSFRDSLAAGWLTADTFNKTMKVMAGQAVPKGDKALKMLGMTADEFKKSGLEAGDTVAYTVDQLKKMGYDDGAAKKLHTLSQASIDSAQKVKTASQAVDVVKESIGSGWAKIFQDLFGNFNQATKLWTGVTNSITDAVGNVFKSVDQMLIGWRKLGGYQDLWTGFGNIFKTIGNLISPFVTAFKSLLPETGKAGSGLAKVTSGFATFTGWMEKASRGASALTPFLVSIFGVFGKLADVVGGVVRGLAPLAPLLSEIGQAAKQFAEEGANMASSLIDGLVQGLNVSALQAAITNMATDIIDWAKNALGIHSPSTEFIEIGYNIVVGLAQGIAQGVSTVVPAIGHAIGAIFEQFTSLFKGFDAMDWTGLVNAILTGGILLMIKRLLGIFGQLTNFGNSISGIIQSIGNSLKAWQDTLKATMLMEIALAIGVLAASLLILAYIPAKKLAQGIGGITSLLSVLTVTMLALSKIDGDKIAGVAASILIISIAMVALSGAIALLGNLDMETLAKGLGAIAVALGIMVGALLGFSKIKGSIEGAAASMLVIALAMNVLAAAVLAFGLMDMGTLAKGLGAMAVGLGLLVASMVGMDKMKGSPEGLAASVLVMALAMNVLALAVAAFGNMDMGTLAKGFGAIALGLGLFVGALLILGANETGTVAAAGAMVLMATAMNLLLGVVLTLGAAPWQVVARGLAFVALALGIFLLAALAAGAPPVAAGLEILGTSLFLIGAALFLAGTGMLAFATGWAIMAAAGIAGTAVIVAAIHVFLALLPEIARQIAASFIAFLKVIANATGPIREAFDKIFTNILGVIGDNIPKIVKLIVQLITEILKGVRKLIPEYGKVISQLIKTGLQIITKAVPQYIDAGVTIIQRVLQGMEKKLPGIIDTAGRLVVKFIEGLGKQASKIVDAAGKTILKFLNAVDASINKYEPQIIAAGKKIIIDIAKGFVSGLNGGEVMSMISGSISSFKDSVIGSFKSKFGINSPAKATVPIGVGVAEGVAKGMKDATAKAIQAVIVMANRIIAAGNAQVLKAQKAARSVQSKAYREQAQADLKADQARDAARFARKHKKDKEAQKRAKQLQNQADKAQKNADKAQAAADRSAQHVEDVRTFQDADLHGKGDIKNQAAVDLADRANKVMQQANAEAARARELMKKNRDAGRKMLKQAQKDTKRAKELAKQAEQAHKDAQRYYAQEVDDRIKQMEDDAAADEQARKDQEAYDAADAQGKSDILTKRAEANEAKAAALKAQAEALIKKAKALADTDAAQAMKLLDQAQQAADDAQAAADQAKEERDQASQALDQTATGGTTSGGGGVIQPSRSILEDAASAVDRYTTSLQNAELLAAAQQTVVQFNQTNTSPEALSNSEIYRQSKNLLSAAEVKMGGN